MFNSLELSWEEIYQSWNLHHYSEQTVLNSPIVLKELFVDYKRENGIFYGYDWLTKDEYNSRKDTIQNNLSEFLYFTKPTNKGTLHTLNMLINSTSDEERAAIWIYAFTKELIDSHAQGNLYKYAYQLKAVTCDFLSQKFYLWHHAMKRLVPEIYMSYELYGETQFSSYRAVIELARLNAALILHEYIPVVYTSLKPGEELPSHIDISLRK